MTVPILKELKSGWLARGEGWAVQAATREEAVRLFHEREEKYKEIDARPFLYESNHGDRDINQIGCNQIAAPVS